MDFPSPGLPVRTLYVFFLRPPPSASSSALIPVAYPTNSPSVSISARVFPFVFLGVIVVVVVLVVVFHSAPVIFLKKSAKVCSCSPLSS